MSFFTTRQIAFSFGPVSVHWYGVMYALGFIVGSILLNRLQQYRSLHLSERQRESLLLYIFLGVVVGGRLGYVLFYGSDYLTHPLEIFAVWKGGMASHGGFIGVAIALLLFCKRNHVDILSLTDVLVIPVAIGLALGRFGNFVNGELYGTITSVPWGMHFPNVEGLRHPTQIYAMLKDAFLATTCAWFLVNVPRMRPGFLTALFLCLYAVLRFIVEVYRDQPLGYSLLLGFNLSRGQLLTIPLFILGIAGFIISKKRAFRVLP